MERYPIECHYVFMILFIWQDIPQTGNSACPQGGELSFNCLPFGSLGFCIMSIIAFLIKKN